MDAISAQNPFDPLVGTTQSRFELAQPLDRGHHLRGDEAQLQASLADAGTEFVPVWNTDNLVDPGTLQPARLRQPEAAGLLALAESVTLLGTRGGQALFGVSLYGDAGESGLRGRGKWVNLRTVADSLKPDDWEILAYARAMAHWHHRARYCGDCGSPLASTMGGHVRRCTNPACAVEHYPRSDPAIIVLVMSGERCLLGRQGVWPKGRYSTLAGFVEPGESVEQAVAREVAEESGVQLREVRYFGSQSFPFPASLMLGFHAEAATEAICLNDNELADARWLTRRELRAALDAGDISLPPRFAISHHLISAWFDAGDCGRL